MTAEILIRPGQRGLGLAEAFARRELLYFLIWRDIKVRYKQTALGAAWALLVPAFQLVVFSIAFGQLAGIGTDGNYPYPLFVLAGLVPWTFFAQSVMQGGQSLADQQHMLTKVYFPRLFIPAAAVAGSLIDLLLSLALLAALLAWYGHPPSAQIVFLPVLIVFAAIASLGAAFLLSALTVRYRDFRHALAVIIQGLMFLSPVIYPASLIPERYHWLLGLNPIAGVVDGFRSAILGKPWNGVLLASSLASALALFILGALYFRRTEREFADVV